MTQAKDPELVPEEMPEAHIDEAEHWFKPGFVRFAFSQSPQLQFFAMGERFVVQDSDLELVQHLCEQRRYTAKVLQQLCHSETSRQLLTYLTQQQWLQPPE